MPVRELVKPAAKIAAWNLAGFGDSGISSARMKRQAEGLAHLDAEIIALVEINPLSILDDLKQELVNKGVCYDSKVLPQTGTDLNIGVMFKCGISAGTPTFIPNSNLGNPRLRQAFVIDMEVGKFDFTLIAVHLKSSRGISDQKTRDEQAKVIAGFIKDKLDVRQEDILLVGDFNMIPGQDVSNFHHLGGDDMIDFLSSWDLQARFSHILRSGRANLLDGFAITKNRTNEYVRGSLRLFPMHWTLKMGREKYRNNVSDHLPFVATFRIDRDLD